MYAVGGLSYERIIDMDSNGTKRLMKAVLGNDMPVMTEKNKTELAATMQYVIYLCCTAKEREILRLKYDRKMTCQKISDIFCGDKIKIRRMIQHSLKKIRCYNEMLKFGMKDYYQNSHEQDDVKLSLSEKDFSLIQLDEIHLTVRTENTLRRTGILCLADLIQFSVEELNQKRGIGKKTVAEITEKVHLYGLKMADET